MTGRSIGKARAAKALEVFGKLGQVSGVGITRLDGGYGLEINLAATPKKGVALPTRVRAVPVRVEVVGRLKKQ